MSKDLAEGTEWMTLISETYKSPDILNSQLHSGRAEDSEAWRERLREKREWGSQKAEGDRTYCE